MAENKTTILCTRPLDKLLIKEADRKGIAVDIIEFIRTEPILNDALKKQINELADQSLTIVFTSMNAVEAVWNYLKKKPADWKIFCIGTATQKLVMEEFDGKSIVGTADSAAELADTIIAEGNISKVAFFCGDQRRHELPEKLKENNIEVNEVEVYKTFQLNEKITKKYNGILFFSPSAVDSFFTVNKVTPQTILFAIGSTTANTIKKYSKNKVVLSNKHGKEDLFEKAITYYTSAVR
ncbi:MAG TPA: uroporphyrinogen-III synthase [Ferruginibacter sp.]|jgi:uroporphyrinogen-III synthase|nr:uroporphyrinogen-III synthase [Ferruginibacter sp.]